MIGFTAISILIVIYMTWTSLSGWAFRSPWKLLICGLLVAGFATVIKSLPAVWKMVAKTPRLTAELDFAAALVDPTLVGLAGGLIAAAVMLKVQILYATELRSAKQIFASSVDAMQAVERADEDLKVVAASLSDEDFGNRLKHIKAMRMEAFMDYCDAKVELKKMKVPGLPGDDEI